MNFSFRKKFLSALLLFALALTPAAWADAGSAEFWDAPPSPEFLRWREERGTMSRAALAEEDGEPPFFGLIPIPVDLSHLADNPPAQNGAAKAPARSALAVLPSKYDIRDNAWLPAIRNQNPFGTCWAFASVGAMESNYLMNVSAGNYTGTLGTPDLSEMQVAWFT